LQRLGIPPGRVQVLYRERQQLSPEQQQELKKKGIPLICPNCNGLGYRGRIALYEFLCSTTDCGKRWPICRSRSNQTTGPRRRQSNAAGRRHPADGPGNDVAHGIAKGFETVSDEWSSATRSAPTTDN
jgi:hypothetical protein